MDNFMLSEKTRSSIEYVTGLSMNEIVRMDLYHEIAYIEKKIGKKLGHTIKKTKEIKPCNKLQG